MQHAKIVGASSVFGLYTILLSIVAFTRLGSSRHLLAGADSAAVTTFFPGLVDLAQPYSSPF